MTLREVGATLAELGRDMAAGCHQPVTMDPYGDSCGDAVFCINCGTCEAHCVCGEPVCIADLFEGMDPNADLRKET